MSIYSVAGFLPDFIKVDCFWNFDLLTGADYIFCIIVIGWQLLGKSAFKFFYLVFWRVPGLPCDFDYFIFYLSVDIELDPEASMKSRSAFI